MLKEGITGTLGLTFYISIQAREQDAVKYKGRRSPKGYMARNSKWFLCLIPLLCHVTCWCLILRSPGSFTRKWPMLIENARKWLPSYMSERPWPSPADGLYLMRGQPGYICRRGGIHFSQKKYCMSYLCNTSRVYLK